MLEEEEEELELAVAVVVFAAGAGVEVAAVVLAEEAASLHEQGLFWQTEQVAEAGFEPEEALD